MTRAGTAAVIVCAVLLAACGADRSAVVESTPPSTVPSTPAPSTTAPSTTAPDTTAPSVPGLEETHGTVDGRAWTLRTSLDPNGSVCMQLWWDDETDRWNGCYPLDAYPGPLPWVPVIAPTSERPVTFVLGVSRVESPTVEVWRGDTRMGAGSARDDIAVDVGGRAFVVPLEVDDLDAIVGAKPLPGVGPGLQIGTLPEMVVVALGADGTELARAGRPIGAVGPSACLFTSTTVLDCPPPFDPAMAGYHEATDGASAYAWIVVADQNAAAVTMRQGETVETEAIIGVADVRIAVVPIDATDPWGVHFTVLDAAGATIAEYSLGQFLGG